MNANFGRQMNFNGNRQAQSFGGMNNRQQPSFGNAPTFDGNEPPIFDGQEPPIFDGQEPPTFDGNAPTFDGNAPMWGNENFAGEEIFKGEDNFTAGNPNDLSGMVDARVDNASDFSEQKMFGNFGRGGFMPASFGGQGGGFGQPQQRGQNHFK